jgi:hypothetical protein
MSPFFHLVRRYILDQALDPLLKAKRYKEVVAEANAKAKVRERIARYEQTKGFLPNDPSLRTYVKRQVSVDGSKYYEAMLGTGDRTGAAEVEAMLVAFDPVDAYSELIAAAKRAGDTHAAEILTEEARKTAKPQATP